MNKIIKLTLLLGFITFNVTSSFSQTEDLIKVLIRDNNGKSLNSLVFGRIYIRGYYNDTSSIIGAKILDEDTSDVFNIKVSYPKGVEIKRFDIVCEESFHYKQMVQLTTSSLPSQIIFNLNQIPICELKRIMKKQRKKK